MPEVTKSSGIILDDPELDEWFSRLAGDGQDEEETWLPREEDDCSDFSYDSDGFLKVAGDGACPSGQGDMRLRGSRAGVYYGRESEHNSDIPIQDAAQGAQRAEIRAALRWALWAWSKTVCLHHGLSAGQRRHRGDSSRHKEKTKVTQRPLEENCRGTAHQRLGEPQS